MATIDDDIFDPQVARVRARLEAVGVDLSTVSNKDLLLRLAEDTRQKGGLDSVKDKYGEGFSGIMFWTVEEEGDDADSRMANALKREFENPCQMVDV